MRRQTLAPSSDRLRLVGGGPKDGLKRLKGPAGLALRDVLRTARREALANAEAFGALFIALERVGKFLNPAGRGLRDHGPYLRALVEESPAYAVAQELGLRCDRLLEIVREARNEAMHQGTYARHVTRHSVNLALLLEDGIMAERHTVGDFMVRAPTVAEPWQLVGMVRQQMIENSFTYLPVCLRGTWWLISDQALAAALRGGVSGTRRRQVLSMTVQDAVSSGALKLTKPGGCVGAQDPVSTVLRADIEGRMVLVIEHVKSQVPGAARRAMEPRLVGILMPFDLL